MMYTEIGAFFIALVYPVWPGRENQAGVCLFYSHILLHMMVFLWWRSEMLLTDMKGESWLYFTSKGLER